ncbi:ATP-binding protein [Mycoplasmopsis bovis]|nr:ATP-binding protein [Mycoplasmopsis bovis]QQH66093.1 ATP-binding protein [Mycoplasmopsis bovis]
MEIKRDSYLNKIIDKMNNGKVKVITGIRRSGKSYFLFNIFNKYLLSKGVNENNIIKISLDSIKDIALRNPLNLIKHIEQLLPSNSQQCYVLIDEIQYCEIIKNPYIENSKYTISFVDVLLELMKRENVDVYVTGSNSVMLSSEILTQFRDRSNQIHIHTLSFSEIYHLFENKKEALEHYLFYGGLPGVYNLKNQEEKREYLTNLFDELYIKDILERKSILKDKYILEILLNFISSTIGSLTNPSKLANRFSSEMKIKISSNTVSNYLNYFKESFLISDCKRFNVKGGKIFESPLKYYFTDIGLRNARLDFNQYEPNHIMENLIYNELKRRGFNINVGIVEKIISNGDKRTRKSFEVDFVCQKPNVKYYIQSAYELPTKEKIEQETRSLYNIDDSFKKIVITYNNIIPWYDKKGVLYIGLIDFLLDGSYTDSVIFNIVR